MSEQFCEKIGEQIKSRRKELDMTLKELSDKVGISEGTMQKYEAGNIKNVTVVMLTKISNALLISPAILAGWENESLEKKSLQGVDEAKLNKKYSQLTFGHKKAVQNLVDNLLECQDRYNSFK